MARTDTRAEEEEIFQSTLAVLLMIQRFDLSVNGEPEIKHFVDEDE